MKHWLHLHWLAFTATLRYLLATPVTVGLNIMVIALALSLPLGSFVVLENIKALTAHLPVEPQLTVFMQTDASDNELTLLKKRLQAHPAVQAIRFISKEQGLKELAAHSEIDDILGALEDNPLPDAFSIILKDNHPSTIEALQKTLNEESSVESVLADTAWAKRLHALLSIAEVLIDVLAISFGVGLIFITGNSIRMQILTRREEIEVSKLIGATDAFIRRPFIYFAMLQGLLGGLLAYAIIRFVIHYINPTVATLATLYNTHFFLHPPSALTVGAVCAIAAILCCIGAFFSVWRHLRQFT